MGVLLNFRVFCPVKRPMFVGVWKKTFQSFQTFHSALTRFQVIDYNSRVRMNYEQEGLFSSLRSVGSAQSPELRPSGVGTTQRHLPREYGVWRLVQLGSGATLAPRFQSFHSAFTGLLDVEVELGE